MARKKTNALDLRTDDIMLEQSQMFGHNLNFAAAEAYKLLRTNIAFSFSGSDQHRVVGVTSAQRGEGKSLTSMNIAYALAETGKEILLIEGDMRIPTMGTRLNLNTKPGLSNLLVGMNSVSGAVQQYAVSMDDGKILAFDVMVSGDVPPNPSELLSSERFAALLGKLRERYDYIILDLPPVTAVTDAAIASRLVDGMLVVVREGRAQRSALSESMRQLRLADAHVIGFVYNGVSEKGGYYRKGYYKKGYYASDYYRKSDPNDAAWN